MKYEPVLKSMKVAILWGRWHFPWREISRCPSRLLLSRQKRNFFFTIWIIIFFHQKIDLKLFGSRLKRNKWTSDERKKHISFRGFFYLIHFLSVCIGKKVIRKWKLFWERFFSKKKSFNQKIFFQLWPFLKSARMISAAFSIELLTESCMANRPLWPLVKWVLKHGLGQKIKLIIST